MQLLLAALLALGIGVVVGALFRRHAILAFCATFALVLCIHLAGDYVRSRYPAVTLHGVAVSFYLAPWPLLLFACLLALGGTLVGIVSCRRISGRQSKPLGGAR
jgi:hypothetical protein